MELASFQKKNYQWKMRSINSISWRKAKVGHIENPSDALPSATKTDEDFGRI
jgi:hypothetical protein